ncbi:MAG TPA: dipeptide ABC transporter ATP-binding protein DppD, partial [Firmicutes bacterium]|nr:dipeptide ABC transporter ATP-binding protein DppD [Bacillota bacterium]
MIEDLLVVEDLTTRFQTENGTITAVDGVSFSIGAGETLGLVGESGCGKSMTSLSVMRLVPSPPGAIEGGKVLFEGRDILMLPEPEMRRMRGRDMAMVFQEPMTSLNPVFTVGEQIMETIMHHDHVSRRDAQERAIEMLRKVGIPSPERRVRDFPHEMSGGMRQRVMIAIALACNPRLLIADEPTTALDVTIQAQILELMRRLRNEYHTATLLITHDLGVIAETADRVAVMYAGQIVESASVESIFENPLHPYTVGLLGSIPRLNGTKRRLYVIEGT